MRPQSALCDAHLLCAFRADPAVDRGGDRERPAAAAALAFVPHDCLGRHLAGEHAVPDVREGEDGPAVGLHLRLGSQLQMTVLGLTREHPQIGVVAGVLWAGEQVDEERVTVLGLADPVGQVRAGLLAFEGDDRLAGGYELLDGLWIGEAVLVHGSFPFVECRRI